MVQEAYDTDFASDVRAYLLDYIKFADAKAGGALTFVALLGTSTAWLFGRGFNPLSHPEWSAMCLIGLVAALVTAVGLLGAACWSLRALAPRTPSVESSLASFPDIAKMKPLQFLEQATAITEAASSKEMAKHAYALARIADAKFAAIRVSVLYLWVAIPGAVALFVVHILGYLQ